MTGALIGWREWVALPDLGVGAIKAKIDTGARSSTLHAWDVELIAANGHAPRVRFVLHPDQHDLSATVLAEADLVGMRDVRSSNGEVESRPVVRTSLVLAGRRYPIELTLTRRDRMGFRMLLGRRALRRRFVIDPHRSFAAGGSTVAPSLGVGPGAKWSDPSRLR
jgi:hypothetical protein